MSVLDRVHSAFVFPRRIQTLASHLAGLLPPGARVLDVGAGDGSLAAALLARRPDLTLEGIDVLVRPDVQIPVDPFDGKTIPREDVSFEAVMLVDVIHHAEEPLRLLGESARVAAECVVVKDHLLEGAFADLTLRFMDRVGNLRHGVALPHTFWRRDQWLSAFDASSLTIASWDARLGLYPPPANLVFERSLHFVARLEHRR